jgi:hypothetical protein
MNRQLWKGILARSTEVTFDIAEVTCKVTEAKEADNPGVEYLALYHGNLTVLSSRPLVADRLSPPVNSGLAVSRRPGMTNERVMIS